jgi:capsular polysaccharide biosynthesis protein
VTVAVQSPRRPAVAEPAEAPVAVAVLSMLRRGWWLGLAVLVLSVASAAFFTSRQEPVYRSSTMVVVMPSDDVAEPTELMRALDTLERRTVLATFARIPMAHETRTAVAERLGRDPTQLHSLRISAGVVPNTNIIRIDVDGPDPELVTAVANAAADHMRAEAGIIYRIFNMRELAAALVPDRPIHPDPRRNLLIAAILGLFGAGLSIFVLDRARGVRRSM